MKTPNFNRELMKELAEYMRGAFEGCDKPVCMLVTRKCFQELSGLTDKEMDRYEGIMVVCDVLQKLTE